MQRREKPPEKQGKCFCPYCDGEITASAMPYCQPCGITLRYCAKCQIAVPREATICPQCGSKLE